MTVKNIIHEVLELIYTEKKNPKNGEERGVSVYELTIEGTAKDAAMGRTTGFDGDLKGKRR